MPWHRITLHFPNLLDESTWLYPEDFDCLVVAIPNLIQFDFVSGSRIVEYEIERNQVVACSEARLKEHKEILGRLKLIIETFRQREFYHCKERNVEIQRRYQRMFYFINQQIKTIDGINVLKPDFRFEADQKVECFDCKYRPGGQWDKINKMTDH